MPIFDFVAAVPIQRTARALQLEGLFEIPPASRSEHRWRVDLPIEGLDWSVGLVVGPSGSGKSTLARQAFGEHLADSYQWPDDASVVDGFPAAMSIKDITGILSSVGFSSPPAWLRPFRCLSNGEQFRAALARAIAESPSLCVVDEFTSVVDRTVAQIGSAAVAKAVRRAGKRFVAVTCHYDVVDWLDPDWIIEMPSGEFTRRSLRGRPKIELEVARVCSSAWHLFKHHHYLTGTLVPQARCFVAFFGERPVAFASAIHYPGRISYWKEHRTVCLPDFQGVGIGNALSEFVAGAMKALKGRYLSVTSSPSMIRHRARSPLWRMLRKPSRSSRQRYESVIGRSMARTKSSDRFTAGFEFAGPARPDLARSYGLL